MRARARAAARPATPSAPARTAARARAAAPSRSSTENGSDLRLIDRPGGTVVPPGRLFESRNEVRPHGDPQPLRLPRPRARARPAQRPLLDDPRAASARRLLRDPDRELPRHRRTAGLDRGPGRGALPGGDAWRIA